MKKLLQCMRCNKVSYDRKALSCDKCNRTVETPSRDDLAAFAEVLSNGLKQIDTTPDSSPSIPDFTGGGGESGGGGASGDW